MSEVLRLRDGLTQGSKFVLLILADCANADSREAWPSTQTIAERALVSRATAIRHLARLEAGGFIARVPRLGTSTLYRVLPGGVAQIETPSQIESTHPETGGDSRVSQGVTHSCESRTIREPSGTVTLGFDAFWNAYPKKQHKPDALKAWQQVRGDLCSDAIVAGVATWQSSDAWKRGYIEHPATFLRQRQWGDIPSRAPSPARHGDQQAASGPRRDPGAGRVVPSPSQTREWARMTFQGVLAGVKTA